MTDPITVDLSDVIATIVRDELPPLARIVDMLPALVYALDDIEIWAMELQPDPTFGAHIGLALMSEADVDRAAEVLDLGPEDIEAYPNYRRSGTFGPWRVRVYSGRTA